MGLPGQYLGRVPHGGVPTAEWFNRLAAEVERLGRVSAASPMVARSDASGVHHAADVAALQALISGTFTGGTVTGDTTFNSTVTFGGNVLQDWTFVSWTGTQNNYALPTGTRYLGVTLTGNATLTGIAGGVEGRALTIVLIDNGGFTLTLSDSSASSSAANRIQLQNLASYVLSEQVQGVELVYASDGATIDNWLMADDRAIAAEADGSPIVSNLRRLNFSTGLTLTDNGSGRGTVEAIATFSGARVTHDVAQSITTGGTIVLAFNTEIFDVGGYHNNSTNNERLTAPTNGYYLVGGSVQWENDPSNLGPRGLSIGLNSNGSGGGWASTSWSSGGQVDFQSVTTLLFLEAGDYVQLGVLQNSGVTLDIESIDFTSETPSFWITRIGV